MSNDITTTRKIIEYVFSKIRGIRYKIIRLFKTRNGLLLLNIIGNKMYVDTKDAGLSFDLILDGIREPYSTQYVIDILKEGDVILDIGANIGYYALLEAKLIGESGKVYAVEPVPGNFELLKKNTHLNDFKHIELFCLGASDIDGETEMFLYDQANWSSMIARAGKESKNKIRVKTVTIDNFLADKQMPSFLRMDVEGFEGNILKGMKRTLENNKLNRIFIELHPHIMIEKEVIDTLAILKNNGFEIERIFKSEGSNFKWALNRLLRIKEDQNLPLTIQEILQDKSIISGQEGAFEIFFKR